MFYIVKFVIIILLMNIIPVNVISVSSSKRILLKSSLNIFCSFKGRSYADIRFGRGGRERSRLSRVTTSLPAVDSVCDQS